MSNGNVTWTNKLPALIIGILFFLFGFIGILWNKSKILTLLFVIILLIGAGFIGYSFTIKEWCIVNEQSAFSEAFAPSLRGCLRMKGWLEF